jgi:hypothetical protein
MSWLPDRWAVVAVDAESGKLRAVVSRHFWHVGAQRFCREMDRVVLISMGCMFQPRAPLTNVTYRVVRLPLGRV